MALGALDALANDLHWYGVELEEKFWRLGNANLDRWREQFGTHTRGTARLVNGDSRKLCELLGPVLAECVVSSPPYSGNRFDGGEESLKQRQGFSKGYSVDGGYGDNTPGQLGALPAGDVDAVVSSPPYVSGGHHPDQTGAWNANGRGQGQGKDVAGYGQTEGQMGQMKEGDVDAVVSSPPWENQEPSHAQNETPSQRRLYEGATAGRAFMTADYGTSDGQLGNDTGTTFWEAARLIVSQCFAILRPGGCAAWVVKAFVRNKAIVDFPGDWMRLCSACGFQTVEVIHASLVKRTAEASLFGGEETKTKERKSFFRRLAEKKGSPRIDHEVVLIMVKPGEGEGRADCVVSSPPFSGSEQPCASQTAALKDYHAFTRGNGTKRDGVMTGDTIGQLGSLPPGTIEDAL